MIVNGVTIATVDEDPAVYKQLTDEIEGAYRFDEIAFRPGDVVLDIGAHKGIVSIYLAKRYPDVAIYAYEPVPEIFDTLKRNLRLNEIANVHPHMLAVNADARYMDMARGSHSAEASAWFTWRQSPQPTFRVKGTTIPAIIADNSIDRVRLLKLDCEGAEHEILADSDGWLDRVDYVRGEIHMIAPIAADGHTIEGTKAKVPSEKVAWQVVDPEGRR